MPKPKFYTSGSFGDLSSDISSEPHSPRLNHHVAFAHTQHGLWQISEDAERDLSPPNEVADVFRGEDAINFRNVDDKLNFLIELATKNMKYSKAIYASNKKSMTGPGYEVGNLGRFSTRRSMASVAFRSSAAPLPPVVQESSDRSLTSSAGPCTGVSDPKLQIQGVEPRGKPRTTKLNINQSVSANARGGVEKQTTTITTMAELTNYIMERNVGHSWHSKLRRHIWRFMEDRSSSHKAAVFAIFYHALLAASVLTAFVDVQDLKVGDAESNTSTGVAGGKLRAISIECCFLVELLVRFVCCPHQRDFFLKFYNIVDAVSAVPLFVRLMTEFSDTWNDSDEVNTFLCMVPVFRLCKHLRYFETFHLLTSAFKTSVEALPTLFFTMVVIVLTFSVLIYYVEPRSNVKSYTLAVWFVLITIGGVAPGEPMPITPAGKTVTMLLMLTGMLYCSIPIGIVGTAFSQVWEDRHRLLLLQKMRNCVEKAGYTPRDLMSMFKRLDQDNNGSLDFEEFSTMLSVMQIGVEDEKFAMEIFDNFDSDCEGSVDFGEMLLGLFPRLQPEIAESLMIELAKGANKAVKISPVHDRVSDSDSSSKATWTPDCTPSIAPSIAPRWTPDCSPRVWSPDCTPTSNSIVSRRSRTSIASPDCSPGGRNTKYWNPDKEFVLTIPIPSYQKPKEIPSYQKPKEKSWRDLVSSAEKGKLVTIRI